jgi:hypothetical protein
MFAAFSVKATTSSVSAKQISDKAASAIKHSIISIKAVQVIQQQAVRR